MSSACSDDSQSTTAPTATSSPVLETFSSGVVPMGTTAHTFVAAQAGTVEITLLSSGPPTDVVLGLGVGISTATTGACAVSTLVPSAPAPTPRLTVLVDAGSFCVKVVDIGNLTQEAFFSVSVLRP